MHIIGNGFLAQHVRALLGWRHDHVTVLAAGVSNVNCTSLGEYDREADLVYREIRRCRDAGRTVVFFSTASAGMYGAPDSPGTEDGPVFPLTAYGRHKLALEQVIRFSGVDHLVLRLSHVVGSGQRGYQLLPALAHQIRTGSVTVFRGASRDLIDVRHVLTLLDLLLERGATGEVVNLASGRSESVERIIDELERRLGHTAERRVVSATARHALVRTERLRCHVPEIDEFGFGPDYLPTLLDRYRELW